MAEQKKASPRDPELMLDPKLARLAAKWLIAIGATALLVSFGLGYSGGRTRQFLHSYLVAFMWVLSIGLGALWWVTLQHLVSAKWSIAIRRIGEILASNMPLIALFALPIVVPTLLGNSELYLWADAQRMHADHVLHHKAAYLNVGFFGLRFLVYFGLWGLLARYMLKQSTRQDASGEAEVVGRLRRVSAPAMIGIAITLTFASFDFMMSLDPMWFSTIFGVYYFAGCALAAHSVLALVLMWLQRSGTLVRVVTKEHYHDIGKMMFAFVVFWAYIGFSQFMLIWYANVPEETVWYLERTSGGWELVAYALLVGHFVMPFLGLLSRHVKRHRIGLAFWAVWLLLIHYVDLYWLIMPQLHHHGPAVSLLDVTCLVGLAGVFFGVAAYRTQNLLLVPMRDPRLAQSLAFENM